LLAPPAVDTPAAMSTPSDLKSQLDGLFSAERTVRQLHDKLAASPPDPLLDVLAPAIADASKLDDEDEASLRLVRMAELLAEVDGPRAMDALIDILASDSPEARHSAGEALEDAAFERFKEVALGIERALVRLPMGSPALPELPYILAEVPEPGVLKLIEKFLKHKDADAVAAAIEVAAEMGDPTLIKHLEKLKGDTRTVDMADDDSEEPSEVTLDELASEAIDILSGKNEEEEAR
jgi:HEAT repeat protein